MLGRKVLQVSRELRDERCGVCALLLQCGELLVGAGKVLGKDGPYKAADCFLACQAQALGAVSIVIPPWNGVFGKYLIGLKDS